METNIEEALKARNVAEERFAGRDFAGAKNYALKAQSLCPGLEGISQMVATFDVYIASEVKCNGEIDYYSILGLKPLADENAVKKRYRKMAVLLHPDKNKCVGADGAFKLISEAWTFLSDRIKKSAYDLKRNKQLASGMVQSSTYGGTGVSNHSTSTTSRGRLDTFWTVCNSCQIRYEYLRKYVNKRLSCKNCRGTFIAVETGSAPVNGSFPFWHFPYSPTNGHGTHGYNGVSFGTANAAFLAGNGVSGYHSTHAYEYGSNTSFQWGSFSGTTSGVMGSAGVCAASSDAFYQASGDTRRAGSKSISGANGNNFTSNVLSGYNDSPISGSGRPEKKRKVASTCFGSGNEESTLQYASEGRVANGASGCQYYPKPSSTTEPTNGRCSIAPAFDARKLLIDKARTEILKKLEEMRLASESVFAIKKNVKSGHETGTLEEAGKPWVVSGCQSEANKSRSISLSVPDPDFHDFDKDRSEECFKPKQIWAIYDEDDGMPRLYCLIRQVISTKPFKVHISYLSSRTDSEFGMVNWIDSGFTKSCGHFRALNSDVIEQVNIFSHLLKGEKAGRGGCVRIFPKRGDIWAVYRNWSLDWNRSTPFAVRHQYEMVEVLDDYSEELGVCVTPLMKLAGFKTVYQRNTNKDAIRWIPRREMLRFSHRVPAWLLEGEGTDLPEHCWDLDPAATPDELLHPIEEREA